MSDPAFVPEPASKTTENPFGTDCNTGSYY